MPLTRKGNTILRAMESQYGAKQGESVFYASINKGKVTGAEGKPGSSPGAKRRAKWKKRSA